MLTIYAPFNNKNSKAWEVFNGVKTAWPETVELKDNQKENSAVPNSMFWGFVGNNLEMVKKHNGLFEKDKLEWIKLSSLPRKKHLFRPWYKRFIPRIIHLLK